MFFRNLNWNIVGWLRTVSIISYAIIALGIVLVAVFLPSAFISGITGQLYQQFALTLSVSVTLSAIVALTLTPALCALILRPGRKKMFFPLGGFSPLQEAGLDAVAERVGATPMQVALAWLLHRAPNILLIPGTSSLAHLRENLAAAELVLPADALAELDGVAAAA